ncbi:MAG: GMC family oxidoreductase [Pseudomonadota bacterium]
MRKGTISTPKPAYDAVIIGSGAGGATLALQLARSGLDVLVVERGTWLRAAEDPEEDYLYRRLAPDDPLEMVGGKTKYYGAALYRYRESDFRETDYETGVSPAWPITYDDLAPYYDEAERLYRVHGSVEGDPSEPPRDMPFPHPPLPHDPAVAKVAEKLQSKGVPTAAIPRGLDYGDGGACTLCPGCDAHHCRLDAKMDAETAALIPALQTGRVQLLLETDCLRVLTDPSGKKATGVELMRGGERLTVNAGTVAVCAGIPGTALILRRSRTDAHPEGLGNATGQLGKRVGAHSTGTLFPMVSFGDLTGRHTKTFAINAWYDGAADWDYPVGVVQIAGQAPFWDMVDGVKRTLVREIAKHSLLCFHMTEALPDAGTGWVFDGDALGTYTPPRHQAGSYDKLRKLAVSAFHKAGYPVLQARRPMEFWHETGSAVMGSDPASSVVDPTGQVHGIKGLYVADASVPPTAAAVNTGLTIMALALRTGDSIAGRAYMKKRPSITVTA